MCTSPTMAMPFLLFTNFSFMLWLVFYFLMLLSVLFYMRFVFYFYLWGGYFLGKRARVGDRGHGVIIRSLLLGNHIYVSIFNTNIYLISLFNVLACSIYKNVYVVTTLSLMFVQ